MNDSADDFAPEHLHDSLLERAPRILRFDPEAYFPEWQSAVRRSFKQLLGLMPAKVPGDLQIVSEKRHKSPLPHRAVHFTFTSEPHVRVPCTLLLPINAENKTPSAICICLQGHRGGGTQVALGTPIDEEDKQAVAEGRDFARQALQKGHAALMMEMRALGQRKDQRPPEQRQGYASGCHHAAMVALMLGRTMMGERVWDVVRALDILAEHFPELNAARIGVMGFSVGAQVAYYAAAFDPRIAFIAASCGVCTYRASLGTVNHCSDAYIPNITHYFDMSDLAGLIVPRPLIIVAGEKDPLFPIAGVKECFAEIEEIYKSQNAGTQCALVIGPDGHRNDPDHMWPALDARLSQPR